MKYIVEIADLKYSNKSDDSFITYSLGSCIGMTLYDPNLKVGGMIHFMLASSKTNPEKAKNKPGMFADTGIDLLLEKITKFGANKRRLDVKIAGAANVLVNCKIFDIVKNNLTAVRKILWKNGLVISGSDVGGNRPRTMFFSLKDGSVKIKSDGVIKEL
jgi:chemotaxis protein CheD